VKIVSLPSPLLFSNNYYYLYIISSKKMQELFSRIFIFFFH